ncbi:MAG: hypothetical protein ABSG65_35290 [Bryobacteraceae bacterium]|jgi:hypothetical protein
MVPNDPVQLDHERRIARLEQARHDMEETLIVIGEIERRQSALLKEHSELIVLSERRMAHVEQTLAEIGDKLNGTIGWAEGFIRPKPPDEANGKLD